uniref:Uncharacterized protein n=1 Tax=Panagrolaimus sp. JU765 TaxID=591449 RepID=A0AC34PYX8_9BILA
MAERAADSLAKLGLYSTTTNNNQLNTCNGLTTTTNSNLNLTNGSTITPMETDGSITAPILQTNGLTANTNMFNIHHRRSKSLRERTGVDQRLERLPSGPPPGQKSVLWTVVKGSVIEKR